jgi:cobaltochelatase CobT
VIEDLGYGDQLGDDPDAEDEDEEDDEEPGRGGTPTAPATRTATSERPTPTPEQSQEEQQDAAQAQVSLDDMADDAEMGEEAEMPEGEAPLEPPPPPPVSEADPDYKVYSTDSTRRSAPRIWPNRSSWNACAPISTSSSSR